MIAPGPGGNPVQSFSAFDAISMTMLLIILATTGALESLRDSPGYQERLILLSDQLGGWPEGIGVANAR